MISTVDIISYRTHEPEAFQSAPEVKGPGFADYLSRIQQEPEAQKVSAEGDKSVDAEAGAKLPDASEKTTSAPEEDRQVPRNEKSEAEDSGEKKEKEKISRDENSESTKLVKRIRERAAGNIDTAATERPEGDAVAEGASPLKKENDTPARASDAGESELHELASADAGKYLTDDAPKPEEPSAKALRAEFVAETALAADQRGPAETMPIKEPDGKARGAESAAPRLRESSPKEAAKSSPPAIELVDLRSKNIQHRESAAEARAEQPSSAIEVGKGTQTGFENSLRQELVVLETSSDANESSGLQRTSIADSKAAADLSRSLRDGGNAEILKKAQFLLKESDQGEIRLILKPEKLGEVRIRLNLNEKHIAGRIIVENSSVREAFQENMELLNRAFREHGFQTDGLDVSVGGRQAGEGGRRQRGQLGVHPALAAEAFDEQVPRIHIDTDAQNRVSMYV